MVEKVNGFAKAPDQFLAAGFEMFTITATTAQADLGNKFVLDAVVQAISMTCAPVVLGTIAGTTTKTLNFAVDKPGAIVAADLQDAIQALGTDKVVLTRNANGTPATFANMSNITVAAFAF